MPLARSALAALLLTAVPLAAQQLPDLAAAPTLLVPAQATASGDLVQVFSDYYQRHPIGSTLAPSTLRLLSASEAASLPALPAGQRYAETEGLIVKVDAAYKLIGIARRAPTTTAAAPAPAPAPTAPAPAPTGSDATSEANANANANATVNININDDRDDEDDEDRYDSSDAITLAEAEAMGIRIPRGHQPEAGQCRVWFPGTPPGRQPRGSASCDQDVPDGAVLIQG